MADDNLYSLLIRVEGGDAAAAEIIKAKYALKDVEEESSALKGKFQEQFQHVALKGFISDAARSVGLGTELRPVITMLNSGLTMLGESLGFVGGNMALATAGLTAIAGLAFVVYEHFHKTAESIDEVMQKQVEALGTTDDLRDSLDRQAKSAGALTGAQKELAQAVKELDASQRGALVTTTGEQLGAAARQIAADKELIATKSELMAQDQKRAAGGETGWIRDHDVKNANDLAAEIRKLNADITLQDEIIKKGVADVAARAKGYKDAADMADKLADKAHKLAEATKKAAEKEAEADRKREESEKRQGDAADAEFAREEQAAKKLDEIETKLRDDAVSGNATAAQKKTAAELKYHDEKVRAIEDAYEVEAKAEQDLTGTTVRADAQRAQDYMQLSRTMAARAKEDFTEMQKSAIAAAEKIQDAFATALAKVIMGHTNMRQQVLAVEKQIEEDAISSTVKVVENYAVQKLKQAAIDNGYLAGVTSAQAAANAKALAAIQAQTAQVEVLTSALKLATTQAMALDAALSAADGAGSGAGAAAVAGVA